MKSPVDIKAVFDAMGDAEQARNLSVSVHVYVDDTAPRDLVSIAMAATRACASNAEVIYDGYPERNSIPDAVADMALVVAGGSDQTGKLYHDLQTVGVPTAVMAVDAQVLCKSAHDFGDDIAEEDVIAPSREKDGAALSDRTAGSPLALDTTDAQSMMQNLGHWIVSVFNEKRLAFAHAFACVRRPLALESVNATAIQNAGIGIVVIIPGADMPLMTLNQVKMLLDIAAAYGEDLSFGRIKEILAVVGAAFVCRGAARTLVSLVPAVGWVVKGGVGYVGTVALGHALMEYFERGGDVVATAQDAAASVKQAPGKLGVSSGRGFGENARIIAGAVKDGVISNASEAVHNIGPTVTALAGAAVDATGFTREDVTKISDKVVGTVKDKFGK